MRGPAYRLTIALEDDRGPLWMLGGPTAARLTADGRWEIACEGRLGRGDTHGAAVADWLARRVGTGESTGDRV